MPGPNSAMTTANGIAPPVTTRRDSLLSRLVRVSSPYLLLAMAVVGVIVVLINTRLGPYLSDDSYYYIAPARDMLAGKGFNPSYIFAPLLPLLLSAIGLLGIEPLAAVRWFNALLFGVNILLAGQVARQAGATPIFTLLAGGLVLLSDVIAEAHGWAMSEALAFTFLLLSLNFTLIYLARTQARYLWLAAAATALTLLTRYAAAPLAAAIALTLLIYGPGRWPARIKKTLIYSAAALAPLAAYWLRNQLVSGHPVRDQRYFFVPFTGDQAAWFFYNWLSLFVPGRILRGHEIAAGGVVILAGLVIIWLIRWVYRKKWAELAVSQKQEGHRLRISVFLFSVVIGFNLLMLILARGLTELDVFNPRYLVPLLLVFLIMLAVLAGRLWLVAGPLMRPLLAAGCIIFLAYYAYRSVDFTRQMVQKGLGYSNIGWHNSETVQYLRANPQVTAKMVSTGDMGIYFWTGHLPTVLSAFPDLPALSDYLCQHEAALFVMNQMPSEIYGFDQRALAASLRLEHEFNDSAMYRCPNPPVQP